MLCLRKLFSAWGDATLGLNWVSPGQAQPYGWVLGRKNAVFLPGYGRQVATRPGAFTGLQPLDTIDTLWILRSCWPIHAGCISCLWRLSGISFLCHYEIWGIYFHHAAFVVLPPHPPFMHGGFGALPGYGQPDHLISGTPRAKKRLHNFAPHYHLP